ncbi:hypothetical protein ASE01_20085 [Nocardioides sp. Root190]|uniref:hypothetical protein n=1 Tax=Nocardioides sp. Root190 TaxID=1736488 RepID=UPI0006F3B924|nr:hypothetical protein [Nocardioides sp. Root190]KRB73077.1 hypothetical protein ASE01_20085 [Nocardioides sp. Root190]
MSALSQLRTELRDKLTEADLFAFTIVPEKVTPPFVYAAPDEPYISFEAGADLAFGEAVVRHRLGLVVAAGVNEVEADALDELLLKVLAIDFSPHVIDTVDEPGQIRVNQQTHLAAAVHLSVAVNLLEAP